MKTIKEKIKHLEFMIEKLIDAGIELEKRIKKIDDSLSIVNTQWKK